MKKSARLNLALQAFETVPLANNPTQAILQLRNALEQTERLHSGLPDYKLDSGYAGNQLHLFSYHSDSPFWRTSDTGRLICQLTSHYAVFEPDGSVIIFTRDGDNGGQHVFSKPALALPFPTNLPLW